MSIKIIQYSDDLDSIVSAINYLTVRKKQWITYHKTIKEIINGLNNFTIFIQECCAFDHRYKVYAEQLRENYMIFCQQVAPGVKEPSKYIPKFNRLMALFIKNNKEFNIVQKHDSIGTFYEGIAIMPRKSKMLKNVKITMRKNISVINNVSNVPVVDNIPVIDDTAVLVVDSLISDNNEVVVDIKTIDKSDE